MQSLRRQIIRGNAVIAFDNILKQEYVRARKGSNDMEWRLAKSNEMKASEQNYIDSVTVPLRRGYIGEQAKKGKRYIYLEPSTGRKKTKKQ